MPGRDSILPDNVDKINDLEVPSPYELLWTTTMSYCNVYFLVYNMFIGVGIPIKKLAFTKDDVAAILSSNNIVNSETTVVDSPIDFLRFREASQIIEEYVFEIKKFKTIVDDDNINIGLNLWNSVQDTMNDFMNNISSLTEQISKMVAILKSQQKSVNPKVMRKLYTSVFDKMILIVSRSIISYQGAFKFLAKYNLEVNINNEVSINDIFFGYMVHVNVFC